MPKPSDYMPRLRLRHKGGVRKDKPQDIAPEGMERAQAKEQGFALYRGSECKRGHPGGLRYAESGLCQACSWRRDQERKSAWCGAPPLDHRAVDHLHDEELPVECREVWDE